MWLPTSVYERLPHFWVSAGILFIAYGLFMGLDLTVSLVAIGMGVVSIVDGIALAMIRANVRRRSIGYVESEATAD